MKLYKPESLKYLFSFLIITLFTANGCYKYPDIETTNYENYRRVIGPDGGEINFFKNYENDSKEDILVTMNFPKNALDSFVVFNMYEFYNEALYNDMDLLNMSINSKFLYFVPFYESYGYNEQAVNSETYHLSIDFNTSVNVTYNIELSIEDEDINNNTNITTKFYRIKIPRLDEWDENVWVNWNYQGYPNGYDNTDLIYLINGRWTNTQEWGTGMLNYAHWEEVPVYTYNSTDNTVSFNIDNTDYLYVLATVEITFPKTNK